MQHMHVITLQCSGELKQLGIVKLWRIPDAQSCSKLGQCQLTLALVLSLSGTDYHHVGLRLSDYLAHALIADVLAGIHNASRLCFLV